MKAKVDHVFNERVTKAHMKGIRFSDSPLPTYKHDSGLAHGHFDTWQDRFWRAINLRQFFTFTDGK